MKVIRLIIYTGTEEALERQLSLSLADGIKHMSKTGLSPTIHVRTLVDGRKGAISALKFYWNLLKNVI